MEYNIYDPFAQPLAPNSAWRRAHTCTKDDPLPLRIRDTGYVPTVSRPWTLRGLSLPIVQPGDWVEFRHGEKDYVTGQLGRVSCVACTYLTHVVYHVGTPAEVIYLAVPITHVHNVEHFMALYKLTWHTLPSLECFHPGAWERIRPHLERRGAMIEEVVEEGKT